MNARTTSRRFRVLTCTALALATGMITAGQALASEPPVVPGKPSAAAQAVPQPGGAVAAPKAKTAAKTAGKAAAAVSPRLDIDGNGKDDFLLRNVWGGWSVRYDSGTTAAFPIAGEIKNVDEHKEVVPVGDLDGNGSPELLTINTLGGIQLHTATTQGSTPTGWASGGWHVFNKVAGAGDLTGDGHPDLLARTTKGQLFLYPGTGKADTTSPYADPIEVTGNQWNFVNLVTGYDFDKDGLADLIIRSSDGLLYFLPSTGKTDAPFGAAVPIGHGWQEFDQVLAQGDKDGNVRLLARKNDGGALVYTSLGNGKLDQTGVYPLEFPHFLGFAGDDSPNGAYGKKSLIARDAGGSMSAYRSSGRNRFEGPTGYYAFSQIPSSTDTLIHTSGLGTNPNGNVLKITAGGQLWALHEKGDVNLGSGWGIYNTVIGVGDLTGDGRGDLLAREKGGDLYLYPGRGTGTGFYNRLKVGSSWNSLDRITGAGDMTGDGIPDLVGRGTDGRLWLYQGTHDTAVPFAQPVQVGSGWKDMTAIVSPGDLNADGLSDLVARDSQGKLWLYTASGLTPTVPDATFEPRTALGSGWNQFTDLI
ncbi:FG-GAP-like repeat-containing protein [Streptomyces sp. NBC_01426]|uniref:FG-GAP repeat domain-containing protein n=1 Tax=unclassified Streptomyces TaxID=2593676 RepID=UPI002E2EBEEF|nr:VCBS repeat-containing protein [Streptomyces sp. NBC_01426]